MKLVKSILLGSAAGLAAVAGAQAADLPVMKAAPVEYVRVCTTYGAGFFYVPGTDSCMRISGRVRFDGLYAEPATRFDDAIGTRVRGRLNVDHRTATAYGLLRTYIRYEITRDTGSPFLGFGGTGLIATDPQIQQGFIQFGGLTAGRVVSFFDNPDLPTAHMGTLRFSDAPDVNLLAYTFSFGGGFSATLSLEDALERRGFGQPFFVAPGGGAAAFPFGVAPFGIEHGGQRMPDVVGNVRYTGTWGGAQLSGAVHQVRDSGGPAFGFVNPVTGLLPVPSDTEYGFAVSLTGYVKLDVLGPGDTAWVAATYEDGAPGYIIGGRTSGINFRGTGLDFRTLPLADAFVNPFTGDLDTTDGWSIAGGFTHNWSPTFRSSIFGSYAEFDVPGAATGFVAVTPGTLAFGTAGTSVGFVDFTEWRIGANTFWQPVSGLNIGVEVLYTRLEPDNRVAIQQLNLAGDPFAPAIFASRSEEDAWEGRLRIQRDF
jgi:hypothetical protein